MIARFFILKSDQWVHYYSIGRKALWEIGKDLGKQFNVKEVLIQGGKRTTGKYKDKVPSAFTIKID